MKNETNKSQGWRTNTIFVLTFILGVMVGMIIEKNINPDKKSVDIKTIQYEQQKANYLTTEGK
jgi:uncharacterized protein YebE (UPF0316 family)